MALFGYPLRIGLTVAAGLGQIGEFSFILGTVGLSLGLLPAEGFQLIVAGALLSIALNPFLFRAVDPLERRLRDAPARWRAAGAPGRRPRRRSPPEAGDPPPARHPVPATAGSAA